MYRLSCSLSTAKTMTVSGGLDRVSIEALVLHLLHQCRDHFQVIKGLDSHSVIESSLVRLSVERLGAALRCVETMSTTLFEGTIAVPNEGSPAGLFTTPDRSVLRGTHANDRRTSLPCSTILRYLHWVRSSFETLIILASIQLGLHDTTCTVVLRPFLCQQMNSLIAAWQRIVLAAAMALVDRATMTSEKSDSGGRNEPSVDRHPHRWDGDIIEQSRAQYHEASPNGSESSSSVSLAAQAAMDVFRQSLQVRHRAELAHGLKKINSLHYVAIIDSSGL